MTTPVPGQIEVDALVTAGEDWLQSCVATVDKEELTHIATAFVMGYAARAFAGTGNDWSQHETIPVAIDRIVDSYELT